MPKHFWCPKWVKSIAHDPAFIVCILASDFFTKSCQKYRGLFIYNFKYFSRCLCPNRNCLASSHCWTYQARSFHEQNGPSSSWGNYFDYNRLGEYYVITCTNFRIIFLTASIGERGLVLDFPKNRRKRERHYCYLCWRWWTYGNCPCWSFQCFSGFWIWSSWMGLHN